MRAPLGFFPLQDGAPTPVLPGAPRSCRPGGGGGLGGCAQGSVSRSPLQRASQHSGGDRCTGTQNGVASGSPGLTAPQGAEALRQPASSALLAGGQQ